MVICSLPFSLPNLSPSLDGWIKGVIVGDNNVSKTCMLISYTGNSFTNEYNQYYFANANVLLNIKRGKLNIGFQLMDTAGAEDWDRLRPMAYPQTDVFIVAFSLVCKSSFDNVVTKWVPELRYHAPDVPIILVGTKLDLRNDKQWFLDHPNDVPISTVQGEKLKELVGASAYIECSAKTLQNLKSVFDEAVIAALEPPESSRSEIGCFNIMRLC